MSKPYRKVLTSTDSGVSVQEWEATHRQITPTGTTPWSVRKILLHGGKQEGVDLLQVDNGRLQFAVIPARGMGLLEARLGDVRLGWDSPVKEVVHPQHVHLHSRGGLGWLEGFNEWVVRCGLESAGAPGKDEFVTNTGVPAEMELTLHGKIANIPASQVEIVVDRKPPLRIRVSGRVEERILFGPKLQLETEISTEVGSNTIRVRDAVTNQGGCDQEFQLIYHVNQGKPLLEDGARFLVPAQKIFPINDHSAAHANEYDTFSGPTPGFVEQVFCITPYSDEEGRTTALLRNRAGNRAVTMNFSTAQLPSLTLWKSTELEPDGYVCGIEPGTGFPYTRRIERSFGRVPWLASNETRRFQIDFSILESSAQIEEAELRVESIQGNRETSLDRFPPAVE